MLQDLLTLLIGLVALAWLLRRWWPARWRPATRQKGEDCGSPATSCGSGCGQCGGDSSPPARDHRVVRVHPRPPSPPH